VLLVSVTTTPKSRSSRLWLGVPAGFPVWFITIDAGMRIRPTSIYVTFLFLSENATRLESHK